MKVPFRLTEEHEKIFRVLFESRSISCTELQRTLRILGMLDPGFKGLSLREKDIKGLEFVGLLRTWYRSPVTKPYLLHDEPDFDNLVISLTHEGEQIARKVKQGRKVIFRPQSSVPKSVFVACAFGHEEIDRLYEEELAPACCTLGYEPIRVDITEPQETITGSIMQGIEGSACVIADLTHSRQSVYFEVGYAHGLGVQLVLTCRSDHERGNSDTSRVHFDLEQYKISFWSRTSDGRFIWPKGMKPADRLSRVVPSRSKRS